MKKTLLFIVIFFINIVMVNSTEPYLDSTLPANVRAKDLVSKMTLAEKITQLGNKTSAISRLNVKAYNYWVEGLHGVARQGLATSFPQPIGMAATWDSTLIYNVAKVISDEARVKNNINGLGLTYWCPVVNMDRDPRWGREEENFGEDTYLASRLAVNYIRGMQGNDSKYLKTIATAKHFACNNVEQGRTSTSSNPDERSLREYFLPVFKSCIQESKVFSIMSAYNAVNSVPSPANRTLLTNILRSEWGFNGFVVSDCDAVSDVSVNHKWVPTPTLATAFSLKAGTDLNCGSTYQNYANDAVNKGLLAESEIDTALVRIFKARFLLGEFDSPSLVPYTSIPSSTLDCKANRDLAYLTAQKAIVLLKNNNSILPLNKSDIKSIAVIGPNAKAVMLGDYSGSPSVSISPFQGIADKLEINVSDGTIEAETAVVLSGGPKVESCGEGGSEIGYIKNNTYVGYDSINFDNVNKVDLRVASNTSTGGSLQILLDNPTTGTVVCTATIPYTGGWQIWTTVTADVSNLSGKHKIYLKFTGGSGYLFNLNWMKFYNSENQNKIQNSFSNGNKTIYYSYGTSINGAIVAAERDSAVNVAKKAQYVIMVCGTDDNTGGEGADRNLIGLPGAQEQLIQSVYAVNPNVILVLVNGFSLAVNWEQENLPAILTAWYGGQAQGAAIADVLFGDYNPGGRLASTWYKSLSDLPSKYDYNIRNNRTYMYYKGTPLYPFGYGLSYSNFNYENLQVSSTNLSLGETIDVTFDVTNASNIIGEEVPQLYINVPSEQLVRPIKQLKGFTRISLQPGETKNVKFNLKYEDLLYYDVASRSYKVDEGLVNLYVGASSQDIRLSKSITSSSGIIYSSFRQNPYEKLEAEHFDSKTSSVIIKPSSEGICVDSLVNNSNLCFKNLNFDAGVSKFKVRQASMVDNCNLIIALDSINGKIVGTQNLSNTGSLLNYTTDSCNVDNISGVHDVFLIYRGSVSNSSINWFSFDKSGADYVFNIKDELYNLSLNPNPTDDNFYINYNIPYASDVKVEIFNSQGVLVQSIFQKNQTGKNSLKIGTEHKKYIAGIYIVKFSTDDYNKSLLLKVN
jgi:beta-glucosidase